MKTPYQIRLHPMTSENAKSVEKSRIEALFTKIENRYWQWRDKESKKSIEALSSMNHEEVKLIIKNLQEGYSKRLVDVLSSLNEHYLRLHLDVEQFNNTDIRDSIAEDRKSYKEFHSGLKTTKDIAIKLNNDSIKEITIRYGTRKKSSLGGLVNWYILDDIANRLPKSPFSNSTIIISKGDPNFEDIRSIIMEETSKHIFENRFSKKTIQPLSEKCCDLYSLIMKNKAWILDKQSIQKDKEQAGNMIIELLGLVFPSKKVKGLSKKDTFITYLHPIKEKKEHSLSDIIILDWDHPVPII